MGIKLLIFGSRDYSYPIDIDFYVEYLPPIDLIISGGARGPDSIAVDWAMSKNIQYKIFYADWNRFGNSAGIIRNREMVEFADQGLAFWDGISRGTKFTIDYMRSKGKKVLVTETYYHS